MEDKPVKEKKENKILWIVIGIIIALIVSRAMLLGGVILFDFIFEDKAEITYVEDKVVINDGILEIKDVEGYYDENSNIYYITGYVTNNSEKKNYSISLTYKIYDKDNNVLGEAYNGVGAINVGETWRFKVPYEEYDASEAVSFSLQNVDMYNAN